MFKQRKYNVGIHRDDESSEEPKRRQSGNAERLITSGIVMQIKCKTVGTWVPATLKYIVFQMNCVLPLCLCPSCFLASNVPFPFIHLGGGYTCLKMCHSEAFLDHPSFPLVKLDCILSTTIVLLPYAFHCMSSSQLICLLSPIKW